MFILNTSSDGFKKLIFKIVWTFNLAIEKKALTQLSLEIFQCFFQDGSRSGRSGEERWL